MSSSSNSSSTSYSSWSYSSSSSSSSSYIENWSNSSMSSSSSSYIENWSSSSTSSSSNSSSSSSSYIKNWSSSSTSSKSLSSSSSSSSSSTSSNSSSSSSDDYTARVISLSIIKQNMGDIIPFSWIAENGASGDGSTVNFTIEASNSPYLDYQAIINRDNSALTSIPSNSDAIAYVPNSNSSKYQHKNSFYIDVIAKDDSGIKDIRTHVQPDAYEFQKVEEAGEVFYIPKFSWR